MTNAVNLASAAGTGFAFRNRIINGDFRFWQRGTGVIGQGYLADRFNVYIVSGSGQLQSRYTLTDAQRAIIGSETLYAIANYTDASTSVRIFQPIEGARTLAGKAVTVSFWAFTDNGTSSLSGVLTQNFGSGGSPSANVDTVLTFSPGSVGTTPTKVVATVTLPSVAGKTFGSSGNDFLGLQIQKNAGTANNLYVTEIQVEEGSAATPFERRPYGLELALCQRYYEKSYDTNVVPGTAGIISSFRTVAAASYSYLSIPCPFKVTKRTSPTTTIYSPNTGASARIYNINTGVDLSANVGTSDVSGTYAVVNGLTVTVDNTCTVHWTAAAEF